MQILVCFGRVFSFGWAGMFKFTHDQVQIGSKDLKMKWASILWRVVTISAIVVFLISIFNPFLNAVWRGLRIPEYFSSWPGEMWSFEQLFYYFDIAGPAALVYVERSFDQYWLQDWSVGVASWTGYALMTIFLLQALTIASGVITIVKNNRVLILLPTVSSTLVAALMSIISWSMSYSYEKKLLPGFWLTLLSIPIFLSAIVVYSHFAREF